MANSRSYYTYSEMITTLREEYLLSEEYLKEIEKTIEVYESGPIKKELFFNLQNDFLGEKGKTKLHLTVSNASHNLSVQIRKLMNRFSYDELCWMLDHASFRFDEELEEFVYEYALGLNEEFFQANVRITDHEKFLELYRNLKKTPLYHLPTFSMHLNPYQILSFDDHSISLDNYIVHKKDLQLQYLSKEDTLCILSRGHLPLVFINELLDTKIPKDFLADEYKELLENKEDRQDFLFIDSPIVKRKEEFSFSKTGKYLVLKKK